MWKTGFKCRKYVFLFFYFISFLMSVPIAREKYFVAAQSLCAMPTVAYKDSDVKEDSVVVDLVSFLARGWL